MKVLLFPFKIILCVPVWLYKWCISPLLPNVCRFNPSCSTYFIKAVDEFGPIKGFGLAVKRFSKCTPRSKFHGYDPVPINVKGDSRWLL